MGGALTKLGLKKNKTPAFNALGGNERVMLTKMAFSSLLDQHYRGDARVRSLKAKMGEITTDVINNEAYHPSFFALYDQIQKKATSKASILEIEQMIDTFKPA
ncbi:MULTISPECIES: hypothetical protein [Enterobacter cloacae complex]|uniref:hypothetical protein n=1 Tax=Enterobacter cloacae complex TaxID=354276 RepID=UPI0021CE00D5|nr:hypothetical protein [Enterobacter cloacae]MCU6209135.1 hypothetical protein [Enterobacter cloacae]